MSSKWWRISIISIAIALAIAYPVSLAVVDNLSSPIHTIVIDAGHGGFDGGVVAMDGTKESELNLTISRTLERELRAKGYNVVMTRRTKDALAPTKKADMNERKRIINEAHPDIVLSIHINRFGDSRRRGAQVFFDDTKKWQREGIIMQNVLNEYINKVYTNRHDYSALGGDYFLTKCIDVPSLIIECGFITSSEDLALMQDKKYVNTFCRVVGMGVDTILAY